MTDEKKDGQKNSEHEQRNHNQPMSEQAERDRKEKEKGMPSSATK